MRSFEQALVEDFARGGIESVDADAAVEVGRAPGREVGHAVVQQGRCRGPAMPTRSDRSADTAIRRRREEPPHQAAVVRPQAVDVSVPRPEQDHAPMDRGRRVDAPAGRELPQRFAGRHVQRVDGVRIGLRPHTRAHRPRRAPSAVPPSFLVQALRTPGGDRRASVVPRRAASCRKVGQSPGAAGAAFGTFATLGGPSSRRSPSSTGTSGLPRSRRQGREAEQLAARLAETLVRRDVEHAVAGHHPVTGTPRGRSCSGSGCPPGNRGTRPLQTN